MRTADDIQWEKIPAYRRCYVVSFVTFILTLYAVAFAIRIDSFFWLMAFGFGLICVVFYLMGNSMVIQLNQTLANNDEEEPEPAR